MASRILCASASGKGPALAVEREIIEPHLHEKLEPRIDLADHFGDDVPLLVSERELPDIFRRRVDRQLAELVNIQLPPSRILDRDRKNFGLQPGAVAVWKAPSS